MNQIDPDEMEYYDRERAYETARQVVQEIVESAECDRDTGEIILWGRWGRDGRIEEERFQSLEDIKDFLASFGWMTEDNTGSIKKIVLAPSSSYPILDDFDVTPFITRMIREHGLDDLLGNVPDFSPSQKLFDFREVSHTGLVSTAKVELITTNDELIHYLASHPTLLYEINPRKLEEIVAEIFEAQGFEVILTPKTRDGGCDVRAVRNSSFGTMLYLIECKKYAADRPVGVQMVRALYGSVTAEKATQGILATTSYFSRDAKQYADKVRYQLSLRDFTNLKSWLEEYRIKGVG